MGRKARLRQEDKQARRQEQQRKQELKQERLLEEAMLRRELDPGPTPLFPWTDPEEQYRSNLEAWRHFNAKRKASIANLRESIRARLLAEGHQITEVSSGDDHQA